MTTLLFWEKLLDATQRGPVVLLYVVDSNGSSPGRKGFKMFVTESGEMCGSIGGGIMEHKLVEYAISLLKTGSFKPFLKHQIHRPGEDKDRSGMICSGDQTIAFYYVGDRSSMEQDLSLSDSCCLLLTESGIKFIRQTQDDRREFISRDFKAWSVFEKLKHDQTLYVVGGGHVGLALTEVIQKLDFDLHLVENRNALNTFEENPFVRADHKHIVDYREIDQLIPQGDNIYVVLVTFSFRTDEQIIKRLAGKKFRYFGVMGSRSKMDVLINKLKDEGYSSDELASIRTPIGLPINSKTPHEIAVSIAAEIIAVKNQ